MLAFAAFFLLNFIPGAHACGHHQHAWSQDRSLRSLTTSTDPSQPGGKCPSCGMSTTKMGYNNLNYVEFTNGQRIYSCGMEPRAFEAYPFQVTDTAYIAANMVRCY